MPRHALNGLAWRLVGGTALVLSSCATTAGRPPVPQPVPWPILAEAPEPDTTWAHPPELLLPTPPAAITGQAEPEIPPDVGKLPVVALPPAISPQPSAGPEVVAPEAAARPVETLAAAPPAPRGAVTPAAAPQPAAAAGSAAGPPRPGAAAASTGSPPPAAASGTGAAIATQRTTAAARPSSPAAAAVAAGVPGVLLPAPAPTAIGAASPGAQSTGAAPAPAVAPVGAVESTVYAKTNDEVEISLQGDGWILLGVQPLSSQNGPLGLEFIRRQLGRESTAFAFRTRGRGDYRASFQRQELSTGLLQGRRILVRVVPPSELDGLLAAQGSGGGSGAVTVSPTAVGGTATGAALRSAGTGSAQAAVAPAPGAPLSTQRQAADRLYALGLYDSALNEYRKIPPDAADPQIAARVAELEERKGEQAEAAKGWASLAATPGMEELAAAGVVRTAALMGDGAGVDRGLDALLRIQGFGVGRELVEVARYADRSGRNALELRVLEEYLSRYPGGDQADEVYYLLGSLLERAWEGRDLQRSLVSYQTVLRDYPTSVYSLTAGDRVDYLKRHFFLVR